MLVNQQEHHQLYNEQHQEQHNQQHQHHRIHESVKQKLIWVTADTHTRLRYHGILGQTFNDVIDNLIDIAENIKEHQQYQKEGEVR